MPKRNKKFLVYVFLFFLPFLFLFSKQVKFVPVKMQIVDLLALPQQIVLFPFKELKKLILFHWTYDQYVRLQEEVGFFKNKVILQQELSEENKRLKAILDFKSSSKFTTVAAKVIGRDPSNWSSLIIIDRGENGGLKAGMPVVNSSSVIGKVFSVGKKTSKVMLLNDPRFSVASILERSRESGLITGSLRGPCRMRYLSPEADIIIGDMVITSSLSSSFPEGFIIGKVTRIEEVAGSPTVECWVKPAISSSAIEEVLVIKR